MRAPKWILLAALAFPAPALAQATQPGTQPGSQTGTKPGTRPADPGTRAGTQAGTKPGTPQTGQPTAAEQADDDVVLNPVDPIGDDEETAAGRSRVERPPLGDTGVEGVGDLEQDEQDDLGTEVDPIGEVDPVGEVDPIGDVNPVGEVDPIDPGVDPREDVEDERDELDPLSE